MNTQYNPTQNHRRKPATTTQIVGRTVAAVAAFFGVIVLGVSLATNVMTSIDQQRAELADVRDHKVADQTTKERVKETKERTQTAKQVVKTAKQVAKDCNTPFAKEEASYGINRMAEPTDTDKMRVWCLAEQAGMKDKDYVVQVGGDRQTREFDAYGNQTITKVTKTKHWKMTFQVYHDGSGLVILERR